MRNNLAHLDQITTILHNADTASAQVQTSGERRALADQLDAQARDAEVGTTTGRAEPALAAQLRARAAQLLADTPPDA